MTITFPSINSVTDLKRDNAGHDGKQADHRHPIDDPVVQVIIAVCCAVVISCVIFACIICLRRRNSAVRRKSSLGHFFITNDAPSPFGIASLNSQLYRSQSEDNKNPIDDTNYNTFLYSEEYPQEEYSELDMSDRSSTPSCDRSSTPSGSDIIETTFNGSPQSDKSTSDMNKISAIKKLRMMRRAKSMGNLTNGVASGVIYRTDNETVLTLCLEYHQANSVLNIDLQDVMDLPFKTQNSELFITAHLFPKSNEGINTKVVRMDEIVHFDEILQFSNVSLQDLEHCTIRLSLFSKKMSKSKTNFIGEAFIQCTEINIKSPSPTRMEVVLQRKRLKSLNLCASIKRTNIDGCEVTIVSCNESGMIQHSTADKHLNSNLGEIFVLLQYNSMAKRMKVFIRRAEHLPKSDRLLGQPVHYIILNIYLHGELIMTKETKTVSGYSPVWNQPFLFDIHNSTVGEHALELVIMRGRRHTRDGVIGRVVIAKMAQNRESIIGWK